MEIIPGTKLGPYEILSPIGAGGMGSVWKARDPRLSRDVAIKVSDARFSERFAREAKAIAALNHPNICQIYDVGPDYIVMEYIEGVSPKGPLAATEVVRLALGIAAALEAAHEKGITHRDLKPANVIVTASGIKLLDFGLAQVNSSGIGSDETATALTSAGAVMGTAAYMSPEQAQGRPADARSDVFSFGLVLYELLSGRRAFAGQSTVELMAAIIREEVAQPEGPANLAAIVMRCLRKAPDSRFQTMGEVRAVLEHVGSDSGPVRRAEEFRVAVLPFQYRGNNADLQALAEGLSEEIVSGLLKFFWIRVIEANATSRYAGVEVDARSAGGDLGARYVMHGSLRHAGSILRIVVQLVDVSTGVHLWSQTYNPTFRSTDSDDIFALQDDLVPRIVSTVADGNGLLPFSMSEAMRNRAGSTFTPYEAVLRAMGWSYRITPEEHAEVRRILEAAVAEAPGLGECHAFLAVIYAAEFSNGFNPRPDSLGRALATARRAIEAAPSRSYAYNALASVLFFQKDFLAFRPAADRAIALNPMDGSVIAYQGMLIAYSGDWDRGCALVERAMQMNPNYPAWFRFALFNNAYRKGEYGAARDVAFDIDMPGFFQSFASRAAVLGQLGEQEPAQKTLRELLALRPDFATAAREELSKWYKPELVERYVEGLRKAGLEIAD